MHGTPHNFKNLSDDRSAYQVTLQSHKGWSGQRSSNSTRHGPLLDLQIVTSGDVLASRIRAFVKEAHRIEQNRDQRMCHRKSRRYPPQQPDPCVSGETLELAIESASWRDRLKSSKCCKAAQHSTSYPGHNSSCDTTAGTSAVAPLPKARSRNIAMSSTSVRTRHVARCWAQEIKSSTDLTRGLGRTIRHVLRPSGDTNSILRRSGFAITCPLPGSDNSSFNYKVFWVRPVQPLGAYPQLNSTPPATYINKLLSEERCLTNITLRPFMV